ncbi:MAG TPA: hypothetical protein EYN38_06190, partial [Flavobacteriales bacterium]|nr:hypothetical protein [Flavobacteriales bacterium]
MKAYPLKTIKLVIHCLLLVSSLICCAQGSWVVVSHANTPRARSFHTAVWTGNRMIVWGGHDTPSSPLKSGGMYDPLADTWSSMSVQNAPETRSFHTAVWTGNRMIVWGGYSGKNTLSTGGMYDPLADTWSSMSVQNAPETRSFHTA